MGGVAVALGVVAYAGDVTQRYDHGLQVMEPVPLGTHPLDMHPEPAFAATRRTATARGGAERNPGSPHPMTPRPNGAHGDHTNPVPCAPSGHRARCVAWSPGFHPGLSPVAPSGHESGPPKAIQRLARGADSKSKSSSLKLETGNFELRRRVGARGLQTGRGNSAWHGLRFGA